MELNSVYDDMIDNFKTKKVIYNTDDVLTLDDNLSIRLDKKSSDI